MISSKSKQIYTLLKQINLCQLIMLPEYELFQLQAVQLKVGCQGVFCWNKVASDVKVQKVKVMLWKNLNLSLIKLMTKT